MITNPCCNCPQDAQTGHCFGEDNKLQIDIDDLKLQIIQSLCTLYENDYDLLVRQVDERSITHRFALYFENHNRQIYVNNHFDIEYHRNGLNPKYYANGKYARPDFIVHRRNCNKHNLIMMEFKTYWNADERNDLIKLRQFTLPDLNANHEYKHDYRPYSYSYGIHIMLNLNNTSIAFYKNGEEELVETISFVREAMLRG